MPPPPKKKKTKTKTKRPPYTTGKNTGHKVYYALIISH